MSLTEASYRGDIDGLRALAIVAVVAYHSGHPVATGGFLGVDVFFVLSGYLITGLLTAEVRRTGNVNLADFYARRARRLLPMAWLTTMATLVAAGFLESPLGQEVTANSAVAVSGYVANLRYALRGLDYFAGDLVTDPLLHTWSLAVEEQFYFGFAPLVWLLAKRSDNWSGFERSLWRWGLVIACGSLALSALLPEQYAIGNFYSPLSRAWELGIGGLLAIRPMTRLPRPAELGLNAAALAGIVLATVFVDETFRHPGWVTLVPVCSTAALVATSASGSWPKAFLSHRLMVWLGKRSYGWYLWHWPITVFWPDLGPLAGVPVELGMPVLSLSLAHLSYLAIEGPIRFSTWLAPARRSLNAAGLLTLAGVGISALAGYRARALNRRPEFASIVAAQAPLPDVYQAGCHVGQLSTEPKICTFGQRDADTVIVLFGDSHMAHWLPAFQSLANDHSWRIVTVTKAGCPSIDVRVWARTLGREYFECPVWRRDAVRQIVAMKPTVIVLSNHHGHRVRVGDGFEALLESPPTVEEWMGGLARTLERFPPGVPVILINDPPQAPAKIPDCLLKNRRRVDRCTFLAPQASPLTIRYQQAAQESRLRFLDLNGKVCPAGRCAALPNGVLLYRDSHHFSVDFARSLHGELGQALDSVLAHAREPGG